MGIELSNYTGRYKTSVFKLRENLSLTDA